MSPMHLRYAFDHVDRYFAMPLFVSFWQRAACTVCIGRLGEFTSPGGTTAQAGPERHAAAMMSAVIRPVRTSKRMGSSFSIHGSGCWLSVAPCRRGGQSTAFSIDKSGVLSPDSNAGTSDRRELLLADLLRSRDRVV